MPWTPTLARSPPTFWTEEHADDAAQAPGLLGQAEGSVATVTADGDYDSDAVCQAATRRHGSPPDVVIAPRASAVPGINDLAAHTPWDRHIQLIAERGRMGWQQVTGYGGATPSKPPWVAIGT